MPTLKYELKRFEFENRIFISFAIVILIVFMSFVIFYDSLSISEIIGTLAGLDLTLSRKAGYFFIIFVLLAASLIRMWAGSILTSRRMMLFKVQSEKLITEGPYRFVRNPIYLADFIAMCGFIVFLPPVGLLLPLLFYLHYLSLISFEEENLSKEHSMEYLFYLRSIPRFFPELSNIKEIINSFRTIKINSDGFRHNALYLMFIPGLILSALLDNVAYVFLIGIPAVIDWGFVHTSIGLDKKTKTEIGKKKSKVFEGVLYAQCWEDPQIDRKAFGLTNNDVVFSITSGGCNLLSFLLDDPKKVIALDLNPYQNYLLELKICSFNILSYEETLELFGVRESKRRIQLYLKLKHALSKHAEAYWSNNLKLIEKGVIHSGRYESYMKLLRIILNIIQGKKLLKQVFECEGIENRKIFYERKWNNILWRIFTRIFLSRNVMCCLFDKAFFRYLNDDLSFGKHFSEKVKYAITELPAKENHFLSYILLGNYYNENFLPQYLKPENYDIIRRRLDRIEIITDECAHYFSALPNSYISKFNFTNIFEWISEESFENILEETIRVAWNKAIITYRNLLVPREHPESLDRNITSLNKLSAALQKKDLSFIYDKYVVEKILKEN